MDTHVEAASLASVNDIAANPPRYPLNPTEEKRQSLVLYIARVPGSNDVFLTTLKPQLKSVAAEDVASSLYYLHLDTPEDDEVLEEMEIMASRLNQKSENNRTPIQRKPLPATARSSLEADSISVSSPTLELPNDQQTRTPNMQSLTQRQRNDPGDQIDHKSTPSKAENTSRRMPLGPRSLTLETVTHRDQLPGTENNPQYNDKQSRSYHDMSSLAFDSKSMSSDYSQKVANSGVKMTDIHIADQTHDSQLPKKFSITLIRRDPSSSTQWNVGKISNRPIGDQLADSTPYMTSAGPVYIHLATAGYNRFRQFSIANPASLAGTGQTNTADPPNPSSGFDRKVRMEWHDSKDRPSSPSSFNQLRCDSTVNTSPVKAPRIQSLDSKLSRPPSDAGFAARGSSPLPPSQPHKRSKPKGYVFESPWNGRCEFSTGISGRVLKCRHVLPSRSGMPGASSPGPGQDSAPISELRFNLPSHRLFGASASASADPHHHHRHHRRHHHDDHRGPANIGQKTKSTLKNLKNRLSASHMPSSLPPPLPERPRPALPERPPPLPERPRPSTQQTTTSSKRDSRSDSDWDDRMDLSLGQEKAGGGMKGKEAKLGKLIIHDEGFKMLDLVVAANMGIWWKIWEP